VESSALWEAHPVRAVITPRIKNCSGFIGKTPLVPLFDT
jgi:hypothetical protein